MICPHCKGEAVLAATLMEREIVSMRIEWEGSFVDAMTVGGSYGFPVHKPWTYRP